MDFRLSLGRLSLGSKTTGHSPSGLGAPPSEQLARALLLLHCERSSFPSDPAARRALSEEPAPASAFISASFSGVRACCGKALDAARRGLETKPRLANQSFGVESVDYLDLERFGHGSRKRRDDRVIRLGATRRSCRSGAGHQRIWPSGPCRSR